MSFFSRIVDSIRAFFAPEVPVLDPTDPMAPGNWADPAFMVELFGDDDLTF
jgi:hypothetical protein